MDFTLTEREAFYRDRVRDFIETHVRPRTGEYEAHVVGANRWQPVAAIEELKPHARGAGLWNLFMPPAPALPHVDESFEFEGTQLTNLEYALCAEEMGRILWSAEVFNCSAPDTGNMEVLHRYGTRPQKEQWLRPLMNGEIRSAFLMTEPQVASSDATNIQCEIRREGEEYVLNGRKWWSSGAGDPRCRLAIVMGETNPQNPRHRQQSMVLMPLDAPGVTVERALSVYGYDDAPHGHMEIALRDVRIPASNMLLGEGRGFEIAQGRLGPGRIHHCMRTIGAAEEALKAMVVRLQSRTAFGKKLMEHSIWEQRVAQARIDIDMSRLLCLKAADMMDKAGNKAAHAEIAMIKVQAPNMALRIIDDAVQAHSGAGVCQDFPLPHSWAGVRTFASPTAPTRSTTAPSQGWSSRSMRRLEILRANAAHGEGEGRLSKAGVISLVRTGAQQLSGSNVRVNGICPGPIETGMTEVVYERARAKGLEEKLGPVDPLKRGGTALETANAALFLASDESSYANGHALVVDGGLSSSHPFNNRSYGRTAI